MKSLVLSRRWGAGAERIVGQHAEPGAQYPRPHVVSMAAVSCRALRFFLTVMAFNFLGDGLATRRPAACDRRRAYTALSAWPCCDWESQDVFRTAGSGARGRRRSFEVYAARRWPYRRIRSGKSVPHCRSSSSFLSRLAESSTAAFCIKGRDLVPLTTTTMRAILARRLDDLFRSR